MGALLSKVGRGLASPRNYSYWNSPYDGTHGRPEADTHHDFHVLKTLIDDSAKALAEFRSKIRELESVEHQLSQG